MNAAIPIAAVLVVRPFFIYTQISLLSFFLNVIQIPKKLRRSVKRKIKMQ